MNNPTNIARANMALRFIRYAALVLSIAFIGYMVINAALQSRQPATLAEWVIKDATRYRAYYEQCISIYDDEPMCRELAAEFAGE